MYDLIYAGRDVQNAVLNRFPEAKIEDASDFIHEERFAVELPESFDADYLDWLTQRGFNNGLSLTASLRAMGCAMGLARIASAGTGEER